MILPIRAYGDPVLRKKCKVIDSNYPELRQLIDNMYQTMDDSNGVGLAAPQIGRPIRMFHIDSSGMYDNKKDGIRKVFINPEMLDEFDGLTARVIQHEFDHLEGILFVDRLKPLKKRLLKKKLTDIAKGNIDIHYKMRFPLKKVRITD